jgi:rSAM/selenodomain-associated transferase 2
LKLSIIIPTLNEAGRIDSLIRHIQESAGPALHEIVIADGGSTDQTRSVARRAGATVVECSRRGRAVQMNRGAEKATGELLYFLHADSYPPREFALQINRAVQSGADAGCFLLRFDNSHPLLRFYSWFTRFDLDIFRYGDQSLFIRNTVFRKLNGFDESLMLMEDHEFVRRIKKAGGQFEIMDEAVVTSARKYKTNGVIRLQFIFTILMILYYSGASQEVLVHLYRSLVRT